ncbi:MAG: acetyl-CoA C-acetyltransferase [Actinomycetota bacterium]
MAEAVIVSATRSPIGKAYKGSLVSIRPDDLAAQMVSAALAKVPELDPATVDELFMGCGLPGGEQGFNIGRVVPVMLGLDGVPGLTVNRYCASSVQTTRMAHHAILAGAGDVFISAGVEVVSRTLPGVPDGPEEAKNAIFAPTDRLSGPWQDPRATGGVPNIYQDMGTTAENVADVCGITREEMDDFALRSQQLTEQRRQEGFWDVDITPVQLPDGTSVKTDDGPRPSTTAEGLADLAPVFREDGRITAGNCCGINDGAAALVIMSSDRARELGIRPLAKIRSTAVSGLSPEIMGLGPVEASRKALAQAGLTAADIDQVEINEAFAAQVIPSYRQLGFDADKVNVNGGAIALGHPYGMTGARITTTLLNSLQWHDQQFGLVTMCVAGGQGMAMIVERV